MSHLQQILTDIQHCQLCVAHLPFPPKPILRVSETAKLLIVGQAPGTKVHATGIPWNDPSGDKLREWLNMDKAQFYDVSKIAIIPTGFCYPGKGKSGDLPPRPECAPQWHLRLIENMPNIQLTLLVGQYAQRYYLQNRVESNLTKTVEKWENYLPTFFPLPHPSPRNRLWFKRNLWFEEKVIFALRQQVADIVNF